MYFNGVLCIRIFDNRCAWYCMSNVEVKVPIKEATISAKVIRADGTVEDLGVVARVTPEKAGIVSKIKKILKWW